MTIRLLAFLTVIGCNLDSDLPPSQTTTVSIAELREMPDGPVDVVLEPTYVTYVRGINPATTYFQTDAPGPAIAVFRGVAEPPLEVMVGNRIEFHVTSVETFNGNKQIDGEVLLAEDDAFDVNTLAQLLTVVPDETFESELVRIRGATIMEVTPPNIFQVQLASNVVVEMFSPIGISLGLCVGATFDAVGVISEFAATKHTLQAFNNADFTNISTAACI